MSSGLVEKKNGITPEGLEPIITDTFYEISCLIIPFSSLIKKKSPQYIYDGTKNIPFNQKDPEFQKIMIQEFLS